MEKLREMVQGILHQFNGRIEQCPSTHLKDAPRQRKLNENERKV